MIYGNDNKAKESLAQFIVRCPIAFEKIIYETFHAKVKTPVLEGLEIPLKEVFDYT